MENFFPTPSKSNVKSHTRVVCLFFFFYLLCPFNNCLTLYASVFKVNVIIILSFVFFCSNILCVYYQQQQYGQ